MSACSPMVKTPPTPSRHVGMGSPSKSHRRGAPSSRNLLLPLAPNGACYPPTPASACSVALCTPADAREHHTPPPELRRESLVVPASDRLVRVACGSGVSVYRMDRSPRGGEPRSPWVLKKANVSPLLVRPAAHLHPTKSSSSPHLPTAAAYHSPASPPLLGWPQSSPEMLPPARQA